jgi:CDP-diacylglycerol--glycerol-3-phosphate 3-phosphatidyltransferase
MALSHSFKTKLPNWLCFFRIGLVALLIPSFLFPWPILCLVIFLIASITDWLDGYLARKWNVQSSLGALIDPVADKMIVACALILLTFENKSILVLISSITLILREIAMSSLRHWACLFNKKSDLPVSWIGKFKTAFCLIAISLLLLARINSRYEPTGLFFLLSAALLSLVSLFNYCLRLR